jgi:ankyrin repeat protein
LCRLPRPHAIQRDSRVLGRVTALISAAMNGQTPVVEQLIAAGVGLDVQNNVG